MLYFSYFNFMAIFKFLFTAYVQYNFCMHAHELGDKLTILLSTFVIYILSISHHAR
jgi:hypothetical protein